ncbi:MAG: histidine kinase [Lachnospiraceae bacterium]|nr:histidine kinase [Lachnospiraceae bacterium]
MKKKKPFSLFSSIQTRINIVIAVSLLLALAMNLFLFNEINSAVQRIDSIFTSNVSVNTLSDTLENIQTSVYEYLNTKSSQALEDYYGYEQEYRALLDELNNRIVNSEILILEKNIRSMSESYLDQTSITVQAKRGRNIERYKESYEEQTQLYEYINSYIYRLNNLLFGQNSANYQTLLTSMQVLEQGSLAVMVVVFLIAILFIAILVHGMIHPLTVLSSTAHEVAGGNLDVPQLPVVYEDEVGVVTRGFNQMLSSIREYIDRLRASMETEARLRERELSMEAHLKEAQLKYLQAQINPHFLFNSLNAGAQLAVMEDADQTSLFLEQMADYFRYSVRKMSSDTTLGEEIQSADNYIYILNVRFAGDITWKKEVDEGVDDIRVPSMILQPLVENAVQHGIHDCLADGCITLSVHLLNKKADRFPARTVPNEEHALEITVRDNGAGMTPERIRDVLNDNIHPDEEENRSAGVAMSNVIHRLELYYNRKNLLRIESDGPGLGTRVIITLPVHQNFR